VSTPDHLAGWRQVRERVAWRDLTPDGFRPVRALRDGFADHARVSVDRGAQRLHRLLSAQDDVRHAAAAGTALNPELLARWNRITLGEQASEFRRGPAYAKAGRERYGLHPATEGWFATCLAQGDQRATPLAARAARIYLDVAFFHPHDNGNARLAALVLQFVLLREQVELDDVEPILNVVRCADDANGAADLARLIHGLAAATHRRWLRQRPYSAAGSDEPRRPHSGGQLHTIHAVAR
jgi:hypothetical protein